MFVQNEDSTMIKPSLRSVALSAFSILLTLVVVPGASAHVIKHHHQAPKETLILKTTTVHVHTPVKDNHAVHSKIKVHADMCVTGTSWLNARSGPSTKHSVLAELGEGQRIEVSTCRTTNYGKTFWCKTNLGYDTVAYVSKKFLGPYALEYRNHKW